MKHILLTIGLGIIAIGQLYAQDVSYWVGQSANPSPIMCHHEAFMDAFIKYIQRPKELVGVVSTETTGSIGNESINQSFNNETCRLETMSSVTYDG